MVLIEYTGYILRDSSAVVGASDVAVECPNDIRTSTDWAIIGSEGTGLVEVWVEVTDEETLPSPSTRFTCSSGTVTLEGFTMDPLVDLDFDVPGGELVFTVSRTNVESERLAVDEIEVYERHVISVYV